jgi:hypothetical protein
VAGGSAPASEDNALSVKETLEFLVFGKAKKAALPNGTKR